MIVTIDKSVAREMAKTRALLKVGIFLGIGVGIGAYYTGKKIGELEQKVKTKPINVKE